MQRLAATLKRKGPLPALWFVTGDEPLLMVEAADAIREAARAQGFEEREVLDASSVWDWSRLAVACQSVGLFASRKIVELRLAQPKPGVKGAQALQDICRARLEDVILVISIPGGDWSVPKTAWHQALTAAAEVVQCRPVPAAQLPGWFAERLARKGLTAAPEALQLLAQRCEGNLLAANQEVLKLSYQYPEGTEITLARIKDAVGDVARFDAEALLTAIADGDAGKALRVTASLEAEGEQIPVLVWQLADEVRCACRLQEALARGTPRTMAMRAAGVYDPAKGARVTRLANKHSAKKLASALMLVADIDRLGKGLKVRERGDAPWAEIASLAAFLAR
ncbi:MAG: DNA polymerase III subunit delta [Duodenibacillus sp.]|nr:DNA polymerase III subunit delta [Duodenibacillus sp.]